MTTFGFCDDSDSSSERSSSSEGMAYPQGQAAQGQSSSKKPSSAELMTLGSQLELLAFGDDEDDEKNFETCPLFTAEALSVTAEAEGRRASDIVSQFGLIGVDTKKMRPKMPISEMGSSAQGDPRLFFNVSTPSSVFICGSQGSGKSHTMNCLLENALIQSSANVLPNPLTGIVFHYDTFVSNSSHSPCEAAWLSTDPGVKVRVLCPPTNYSDLKASYSKFKNVEVEMLQIDEANLNTKRMLDLMAVSSIQGGGLPLYLHILSRILRMLRSEQQTNGGSFQYQRFKAAIEQENLTPGQKAPLSQRLDTLESFMVRGQVSAPSSSFRRLESRGKGNDWTPKAGQLTIVDLSCPCVTAEAACALFNICLSMFLEQDPNAVGRIIALDEAHKYMTDGAECMTLTEQLLSTIRLQRHLAARVIVSTQEPTISPKLLDLCSVTIAHRFTSPAWFQSLRRHLAGAAHPQDDYQESLEGAGDSDDDDDNEPSNGTRLDAATAFLSRIVSLRTGEALLFSPSAIVAAKVKGSHDGSNGVKRCRNGLETLDERGPGRDSAGEKDDAKLDFARLGHGFMKVRIRKRITMDGGRSIMAN